MNKFALAVSNSYASTLSNCDCIFPFGRCT